MKQLIKSSIVLFLLLSALWLIPAQVFAQPAIYFNGTLDYTAADQTLIIQADVTGFEEITGLAPGDDIFITAVLGQTGYFSDGMLDINGGTGLVLTGTDLAAILLGQDNSPSATLVGGFLATGPLFTGEAVFGALVVPENTLYTADILDSDFTAQINGAINMVPVPAAGLLFGFGIMALGLARRKDSLKKILPVFCLAVFLALQPAAARANFLDLQTLSTDTGITLDGESLVMDMTAIALGGPYEAIDPVDFSLTATLDTESGFYTGSLVAGDLVSADFDNLLIQEVSQVTPFFTFTWYDISADLVFTGGFLTAVDDDGFFFGSADSLDAGRLAAQIRDMDAPIGIQDPVPAPAAGLLLFSGLSGLIFFIRRQS